jgi:Ca2+-binding EF-hand superfamily protein
MERTFWHSIIDLFDADKNGYIEAAELHALLEALHSNIEGISENDIVGNLN